MFALLSRLLVHAVQQQIQQQMQQMQLAAGYMDTGDPNYVPDGYSLGYHHTSTATTATAATVCKFGVKCHRAGCRCEV